MTPVIARLRAIEREARHERIEAKDEDVRIKLVPEEQREPIGRALDAQRRLGTPGARVARHRREEEHEPEERHGHVSRRARRGDEDLLPVCGPARTREREPAERPEQDTQRPAAAAHGGDEVPDLREPSIVRRHSGEDMEREDGRRERERRREREEARARYACARRVHARRNCRDEASRGGGGGDKRSERAAARARRRRFSLLVERA